MNRRGHSLLELIVVIAIVATAISLSLPAMQRARASAMRTSCANNLRQVGLAVHSTFDTAGFLPYARECPAPWRNGQDIHCQTLPVQNFYTGPLERWWAPYDNRPGTLPTRALPGYSTDSFLWDFVGRDARIFHCPEGVDRTPGNPTNGEYFQISYALDPDVGGKRLGDLDVPKVLVWEHDDLPACQSLDLHWVNWSVAPEQRLQRHSPGRHIGMANLLFRDGSVATVSR